MPPLAASKYSGLTYINFLKILRLTEFWLKIYGISWKHPTHIYLQKAGLIFLIFFIFVPERCHEILSILGSISHREVTVTNLKVIPKTVK
jgi:hypothetical protein